MNWQKIDKDDYKAEIGDYMLRAEKMDKKYWWWCVYKGEETIAADWIGEYATTEKEAKLLAEVAYLKDKYE